MQTYLHTVGVAILVTITSLFLFGCSVLALVGLRTLIGVHGDDWHSREYQAGLIGGSAGVMGLLMFSAMALKGLRAFLWGDQLRAEQEERRKHNSRLV